MYFFQDGSHATLRSLEELLNEFFGSATNNERKRQIGNIYLCSKKIITSKASFLKYFSVVIVANDT